MFFIGLFILLSYEIFSIYRHYCSHLPGNALFSSLVYRRFLAYCTNRQIRQGKREPQLWQTDYTTNLLFYFNGYLLCYPTCMGKAYQHICIVYESGLGAEELYPILAMPHRYMPLCTACVVRRTGLIGTDTGNEPAT